MYFIAFFSNILRFFIMNHQLDQLLYMWYYSPSFVDISTAFNLLKQHIPAYGLSSSRSIYGS